MIACVVNQEDEFAKLLQLGMKDAADQEGIQTLQVNTNGKLNKEIGLINNYIDRNVDGICILPVGTDISLPAIKKASRNGVKIIFAGIEIGKDGGFDCIESDQSELGRKSGEACREFIVKKLGGKANIAILRFNSQFPEISKKRTESFVAEVTKLPGVRITAERDAWLAEKAVAEGENIIKSQPNLDIIWAANEGATVGATIAVKNTGKNQRVFVFGTDVSKQIANMLLSPDNILQAVTGQQSYEIGKQAMERLIKKIRGQSVEKQEYISDISLSRDHPEKVAEYLVNLNKQIISN